MPSSVVVKVMASLMASAATCSVAMAQSWPVRCERPANAVQRQAIDTAEALFDQSWLKRGAGRVTAFKTKPEVVNPLAPREPKAEPPRPAITGFVLADGVTCQATETPGEVLVEFVGSGVRFFEDGAGWSGVLPQGLLLAVGVKQVDGAARITVKTEAATVTLPDATMRKPDASEVPPLPTSAAKSKKR